MSSRGNRKRWYIFWYPEDIAEPQRVKRMNSREAAVAAFHMLGYPWEWIEVEVRHNEWWITQQQYFGEIDGVSTVGDDDIREVRAGYWKALQLPDPHEEMET